MTLDISTVFQWIQDAATGGLDILGAIAQGLESLFFVANGEAFQLTLLGVLVIAGVGAPMAWKFIKYIISLFKQVKPN